MIKSKISIFIVDDHPSMIEGYKSILSYNNLGCEISVTPAYDCESAIKRMEESEDIYEFDMIFLDLSLPPYEEKEIFLSELGLSEPGLNRLIRASYKLLGLQTYFTAGVKEVRAWTIKEGFKAPQAAGVIHTDFEKGFIRAEVIKYEDFVKYGSEAACRDAGKLSVEGKEYVVGDGDVMHFRFNV